MMPGDFSLLACLPADWRTGTFLGRVLTPEGPSPIGVAQGMAYDISGIAPTVAQLVEMLPLAASDGVALGALDALTLPLLSPIDLQCVKACGVTFALSAIERVIEE
ncbi:MAG: fumarylacetoacetate hydrolase, partial [bacterium]|nr:fumarylacetoacetate hydrolase [bacterium]